MLTIRITNHILNYMHVLHAYCKRNNLDKTLINFIMPSYLKRKKVSQSDQTAVTTETGTSL